MHTPDFSRSRIDAMINLSNPLAVLATRLPWARIEALLAPKFEHCNRAGDNKKLGEIEKSTVWRAR